MKKRFKGGLAILAVCFLFVGCVSREESKRHWQGRMDAIVRQGRQITAFLDRYLLGYTWDDPYALADPYAPKKYPE